MLSPQLYGLIRNLSVTRTAERKHRLAISSILPAISRVISVTFMRSFSGIFCSTSITVSAFVPAIMAKIAPFLPLAALLVSIVYSSP